MITYGKGDDEYCVNVVNTMPIYSYEFMEFKPRTIEFIDDELLEVKRLNKEQFYKNNKC